MLQRFKAPGTRPILVTDGSMIMAINRLNLEVADPIPDPDEPTVDEVRSATAKELARMGATLIADGTSLLQSAARLTRGDARAGRNIRKYVRKRKSLSMAIETIYEPLRNLNMRMSAASAEEYRRRLGMCR